MSTATAYDVETVVLVFPNGEWVNPSASVRNPEGGNILSPDISFTQNLDQSVLQTLSTHDAPVPGPITGLLYVPDLAKGDPCIDISSQYVPSNVTRRANLSPAAVYLIALAPWISAECTQGYLAAARRDAARSFLFYLVGNETQDMSAQPPPISSPVWSLNDGGAWRSENTFPIYATPLDVGSQLMYQLSLYSGNMTQVPYGHEISEMANTDPRDYVRMYTQINLSNISSVPRLWEFALIVVGILLLMLASTSATMHLVQRSRRNALRRRIINREVDLEALGIKRLTVPQEVIDKCPLFTYNCEDENLPPLSASWGIRTHTTVAEPDNSTGPSQSAETPGTPETKDVLRSPEPRLSATDEIASGRSSLAHTFLPYSQPTCPICLDDFKSGITPIRELPCGHIFHPECIDPFLANNSSLCPMCKKSVLPSGYCPTPITNSIVRRERNLRRLRSRVTVNEDGGVESPETRLQHFGSDFRSFFQRSPTTRHVPGTLAPIPLRPQPALTADATTLNARVSVLGNETAPGGDQLSRWQVAQRRIQELATEQPPMDADVATEIHRPRWRRVLGGVFPGF